MNVSDWVNFSTSGEDVAQLIERRTGTPLTQVRFPGAARVFFFFFSQSQLSVQTLTVSVQPPCAIVSVSTLKDPVVLIRVRWIMETLSTQHAQWVV